MALDLTRIRFITHLVRALALLLLGRGLGRSRAVGGQPTPGCSPPARGAAYFTMTNPAAQARRRPAADFTKVTRCHAAATCARFDEQPSRVQLVGSGVD